MECLICGIFFEIQLPKDNKNKKYCSNKCKYIAISRNQKNSKLSNETKKKISISRIKYLEKNKHKHNWSLYNNKQSYPEKLFETIILKLNETVFKYYIPPESKRFFEIDFAIPDKKIGFEINGNQHYNKNKELTEYYKNRHIYLKSLGWKIIEIPYLLCYDQNKIINIIESELNKKLSTNSFVIIDYKKYIKNKRKNIKKNKRNRIQYLTESRKKYEKSQQIYIENVKKSNIDFSKFGWVKLVSIIINQKSQKTGYWMKQFLPEIYSKCYKRKKNKYPCSRN